MALSSLIVSMSSVAAGPDQWGSLLVESPYGVAAMHAFEAAPWPAWPTLPDAEEKSKDYEFSYTYAQVGYDLTHLDEADEDVRAIHGRASLELLWFFHVFADYSRGSSGLDDANVDEYGLGVGAHLGVLPRLDLVAEVSWLYDEIDGDTLFDDDSDTGWSGYLGARWMVLPWSGGGVELNGGYRYVNLDSLLSDQVVSSWELGARVHLLKFFSVGATYAHLENDDAIAADLRISF